MNEYDQTNRDLLVRIDERVIALHEKIDDMDIPKRLGSLERSRAWAAGVVALLIVSVGSIIAVFRN